MMAGLLTDSLFETFPTVFVPSVYGHFPKSLDGASQQRDCPGISPDSLLIRSLEQVNGTNLGTKMYILCTQKGPILPKKGLFR